MESVPLRALVLYSGHTYAPVSLMSTFLAVDHNNYVCKSMRIHCRSVLITIIIKILACKPILLPGFSQMTGIVS